MNITAFNFRGAACTRHLGILFNTAQVQVCITGEDLFAPFNVRSGTRISATRGAIDSRDYYIRYNDQMGLFNVRLSANYHEPEGFGTGYEAGDPNNPPLPVPDDGDTRQFNLRSTYTSNLHNSFGFLFGYSNGEIGARREGPPELITQNLLPTYTEFDSNNDFSKMRSRIISHLCCHNIERIQLCVLTMDC